MSVLLTTEQEWDTWFTGSVEEAIALQKPLQNEFCESWQRGEELSGAG
jgi:putative SOS response-associated peptidase YedK